MHLLSSLGEVVTIQIDLIGVDNVSSMLREEFDDSEKEGLYVDNMILQRIMDGQILDYEKIFDKIVEITGEYESIDSITALIRMMYKDDPVEVTVQLIGGNDPQLLQATDHKHYFELSTAIQTRWQFAKNMSR